MVWFFLAVIVAVLFAAFPSINKELRLPGLQKPNEESPQRRGEQVRSATFNLETWTSYEGDGWGMTVKDAEGTPVPWREWEEVTERQLQGVPVVGCRFRGNTITRDEFRPGMELTLHREPENPKDPNAVAVYDATGTHHVGYVPREMTQKVWREFGSGARAWMVWEVLEGEERTGGRLLLVRPSLFDQIEGAMTTLRMTERFT